MIVVDTNIIGYLLLSSPKTPVVEKVLTRDAVWTAPCLWRSEMHSVLALYMRRGLVSLDHAKKTMEAAVDLMRGQEYEVTSANVLKLAGGSTCSGSDCEFVALARDMNTTLVTVDQQILKDFADIATLPGRFVLNS